MDSNIESKVIEGHFEKRLQTTRNISSFHGKQKPGLMHKIAVADPGQILA